MKTALLTMHAHILPRVKNDGERKEGRSQFLIYNTNRDKVKIWSKVQPRNIYTFFLNMSGQIIKKNQK